MHDTESGLNLVGMGKGQAKFEVCVFPHATKHEKKVDAKTFASCAPRCACCSANQALANLPLYQSGTCITAFALVLSQCTNETCSRDNLTDWQHWHGSKTGFRRPARERRSFFGAFDTSAGPQLSLYLTISLSRSTSLCRRTGVRLSVA